MAAKTERIKKRVRLAGLDAEKALKRDTLRQAGLRAEKLFFGPRGIFAKAGHTEHLKTRKNPNYPYYKVGAYTVESFEEAVQLAGVIADRTGQPIDVMEKLDSHTSFHSLKEVYPKNRPHSARSNPITVVGNPLRKSKPEWYYDAGMRSYILDLKGSVYILSPTGDGFKYSLSVGGDIIHYSKTFPEIELAMDAIDHGQGKKFKRPPGIYGSTRLKPNPPARINTTVAGVLYNRCREIRAEKTSKTGLKGLYYHPFLERSKVCVLALDNGDILIHSQAGEKLWKLH